MIKRLWWAWCLAAGLSLYLADPALAGQTCIDGVDCYCDCVQGTNRGDGFVNAACAAKAVPVDTAALLCEDFESRNLTENVGAGAGAPNYGPWYDVTGSSSGFGRGANSYWTRKYGSVGGDCAWTQGQPASPKLGVTCGPSTCFVAEWSAGDPWDGNAKACIDIVRDGEFDDERPLASPIRPAGAGGGAGVLDGRQSMAHRVAPGRAGDFHGSKGFGRRAYDISMTWAMAFPSDIATANLINQPWKFNEFRGSESGGADGWPVGNTSITAGHFPEGASMFPFAGYLWATSQSACQHMGANLTAVKGQMKCGATNTGANYGTKLADYNQPVDWPFGTWGCVQARLQGLNATTATYQVWFNGKLIIHITNIPTVDVLFKGPQSFDWNAYANANQPGGSPSNKVVYRYEDNMHIRQGAPVSCAQIGFGGGTPPPVPVPLGRPGTPVYVP